jgi:hypothetical protein
MERCLLSVFIAKATIFIEYYFHIIHGKIKITP